MDIVGCLRQGESSTAAISNTPISVTTWKISGDDTWPVTPFLAPPPTRPLESLADAHGHINLQPLSQKSRPNPVSTLPAPIRMTNVSGTACASSTTLQFLVGSSMLMMTIMTQVHRQRLALGRAGYCSTRLASQFVDRARGPLCAEWSGILLHIGPVLTSLWNVHSADPRRSSTRRVVQRSGRRVGSLTTVFG